MLEGAREAHDCSTYRYLFTTLPPLFICSYLYTFSIQYPVLQWSSCFSSPSMKHKQTSNTRHITIIHLYLICSCHHSFSLLTHPFTTLQSNALLREINDGRGMRDTQYVPPHPPSILLLTPPLLESIHNSTQ